MTPLPLPPDWRGEHERKEGATSIHYRELERPSGTRRATALDDPDTALLSSADERTEETAVQVGDEKEEGVA